MLHYRIQVQLGMLSLLLRRPICVTLSRCGTKEDAVNSYYRLAQHPVVARLGFSGQLRCVPPTPYTSILGNFLGSFF